MKQEPKYKMIQVPEEVHRILKQYCKKHGFSISGLVSSLIRRQIYPPSKYDSKE